MTIFDEKPLLYGFTEGQLYDLTAAIKDLTPNTEIIPFFSPASNTQVIMMDSSQDVMRIYEHEIK